MLCIGAVATLEPEDIQLFPAWMKPGAGISNGLLQEAYTINDNEAINDEHREAMLKYLFVRNGDEIVFEN
jgi:hypothetical protein